MCLLFLFFISSPPLPFPFFSAWLDLDIQGMVEEGRGNPSVAAAAAAPVLSGRPEWQGGNLGMEGPMQGLSRWLGVGQNGKLGIYGLIMGWESDLGLMGEIQGWRSISGAEWGYQEAEENPNSMVGTPPPWPILQLDSWQVGQTWSRLGSS